MRKIILGMIAGMTMLSATSAHAAACGEVVVTEMNWASAQVVTAVAKFLMTQGYGCDVTVLPSTSTPAIASIAETGKPDIVTELWAKSVPFYRDLENAGKVKTAADVLSDGGVEGWWIPTYLAEAHPELTTIEGIMANPQLVGGKFHNCPDDWSCRKVNDSLIAALKLDGAMEIFDHGSGETLAASIAAAYTDTAPWFGYYWAPTSVLGKYPMVPVRIGDHVPDIHDCNAMGPEECAAPGLSDYPHAAVLTAVTTDMAARNPAVYDLMTKLSFTNAQMGAILAWKEDNRASADEAAAYFLQTYKSVWGDWLNEDARTRLAGLLN